MDKHYLYIDSDNNELFFIYKKGNYNKEKIIEMKSGEKYETSDFGIPMIITPFTLNLFNADAAYDYLVNEWKIVGGMEPQYLSYDHNTNKKQQIRLTRDMYEKYYKENNIDFKYGKTNISDEIYKSLSNNKSNSYLINSFEEVIVIDLDTEKSIRRFGEICKSRNYILDTFIVRTPRRKGYHIYFQKSEYLKGKDYKSGNSNNGYDIRINNDGKLGLIMPCSRIDNFTGLCDYYCVLNGSKITKIPDFIIDEFMEDYSHYNKKDEQTIITISSHEKISKYSPEFVCELLKLINIKEITYEVWRNYSWGYINGLSGCGINIDNSTNNKYYLVWRDWCKGIYTFNEQGEIIDKKYDELENYRHWCAFIKANNNYEEKKITIGTLFHQAKIDHKIKYNALLKASQISFSEKQTCTSNNPKYKMICDIVMNDGNMRTFCYNELVMLYMPKETYYYSEICHKNDDKLYYKKSCGIYELVSFNHLLSCFMDVCNGEIQKDILEVKKYLTENIKDFNPSIINRLLYEFTGRTPKSFPIYDYFIGTLIISGGYKGRHNEEYWQRNQDIFYLMDANPFCIGFNNGYYNLANHTFYDGINNKGNDYVSISVGYDYKVTDYSIAYNFLRQYFVDGEIGNYQLETLISYMATCLSNNKIDKFLILNGCGGNGKSKVCEYLYHTLGEYSGMIKEEHNSSYKTSKYNTKPFDLSLDNLLYNNIKKRFIFVE